MQMLYWYITPESVGYLHKEGSASVDVLHEVVALHVQVFRAGQVDGTGVVHQDVDTSKSLDGFVDSGNDLRLFPHIHDTWQTLSSSIFH